jgi:hypothetical protein
VNEVRRLIADLDAVSADLSRVLRETEATAQR